MIKFAAIMSILTIAFALTMSAMLALGRATPLPEEVAALHLGDMCELPCWIGITPGQTTIAEAEKQMKQVYKNWQPLRESEYTVAFTVTTLGEMQLQVMFTRMLTSDVIDEIQFKLSDPKSIGLGYAMSVLPSPKMARLWAGSSQTDVFHDWYQLWFAHSPRDHAHQDIISPQNTFYGISLLRRSNGDASYSLWHGFGLYDFEYIVFGDFEE